MSNPATDPHGATLDDPACMRRADGRWLARALAESRARTLRTFDAYERALGAADMRVPFSPELNPPLWELGHVGWFQEYWLARNPQRDLGAAADGVDPLRLPSLLADADRFFDSGRVAHATRWQLPLPDSRQLRQYLEQTLERNLQVLDAAVGAGGGAGPMDGARYFGWLALAHEDMHHEAAQYMANALAMPLQPPLAPPGAGAAPGGDLAFAAGPCACGLAAADAAFDNELSRERPALASYRIDALPVTNAAYAAFVDAGGYDTAAFWSGAGWQWRTQAQARWPRYWRRSAGRWQQCWFGCWADIEGAAPVVNVNAHEADAWCRWAGRRLPTEVQWENAALRGGGFEWGQVWEWTASAFEPYPGFAAHPYRDYSQPWFGSRRVLRGASRATHPRLHHPCYRNFYPPERNDIFAGLRTCPLD